MYANANPPFNFLGHMSESQKTAFVAWVTKYTASLPQVAVYHQIKAQQLRKLAGALEEYYSTVHEETLAPTFVKAPWAPGPDGHFAYEHHNDTQPMVAVATIKKALKSPLQRQDDGIFFMNQVRRLIEKQEDHAQVSVDGPTTIPGLISALNSFFEQPQYQSVLVKDTSDTYKGQPRYRVNQLDPPTPWELDVFLRRVEA